MSRWPEAARIRDEWLAHGLSTVAAERAAAEDALGGIYARINRPRPRFEWVDSPYKALPLVAGLPTLDELYQAIRRPATGGCSVAGDIATSLARLRGSLSERVQYADPELTSSYRRKKEKPRPPTPVELLHAGIRKALYRRLANGFFLPVKAALSGTGRVPVCWYGQQDASWIAYYDALHRLGLAGYVNEDRRAFDDWAGLARSAGWWWPGEGVCVAVERPARISTVDTVDTVEYRDGWSIRSVHTLR